MKSYLEIYTLEMEAENLSKHTIRNKVNTLMKFCNYIGSIDNLTKANVNKYIASLNVKDSSKKQYVKIIKTFIKFLYEEEYIDKPINLKAYKTDKVIQEHITDDDIQRILRYLSKDKSFLGVRNLTIISTFIDTGLRVSELVGLNVSDIENSTIKVYCKRKQRLVPISAKLKLQLKKYLLLRSKHSKDDALFISRSGNRLKIITIQKMVKDIGESLSIDIHPHLFRHYFIQSLLKQGVNIFYISKIVGHEAISTTEAYLRSMETDEILNDMKHFTNL